MKKFLIPIIISLLFSATMNSESATDPTPVLYEVKAVSFVDLEKFSGKWYEISSYPNKLQEKCLGNTTVTYTIKKKNKIKILNECLKKNGKTLRDKGNAKITDLESNSKWKVKFSSGIFSVLPFGSNKFWIVDLDKNYKYAAIGTPKREFLMILSRTPEIEDKTYQGILRRAEKMGFVPNKLIKTQHNLKKN